MNNQAPELSPEARRIISAARGADDPTADDQERVKARWLASIAAVAGVSSLTEAARAAGGIGWGLKAAGAALVMAAGAVGLYVALPSGVVRDGKQPDGPVPGWIGTTHGRFEKTSPSERPEAANDSVDGVATPASRPLPSGAAPAPRVVAVPVVASPPSVPSIESAHPAPSVLEPAEVPTREGHALDVGVEAPVTGVTAAQTPHATADVVSPPSRRARSKAPVPPRATRAPVADVKALPATEEAPVSAAQSGQLSEELSLLSGVRSSVQSGSPGRALELLGQYRSRFGQPILGMEADALRVDALCKAGQVEAARSSARAFQNDWPNSPLKQRVNAACP